MAGTEASGWIGGNEIEMEQEAITEFHDHWLGVFKSLKNAVAVTVLYFLGKRERSFFFGEKRCVDISSPECEERELSRLNNFFLLPLS